MNERIQQLRAKALVPIQKDGYTSWVFSEDKFAELIVRECAKICADTAVESPPNDLFEGYNMGVNKAAENIKEHFGVEE